MSNEQEQSAIKNESSAANPSGADLAEQVILEWQSKGKDVVNKSLSNADANKVIEDIYARSGKKYGRGVAFTARRRILEKKQKEVMGDVNGLGAKVVQPDDDFSGGEQVKKVEDGEKSGEKLSPEGVPLGEQKPVEPVDKQSMHTIIDAFIDMAGETYDKMHKPIPKERLKMSKELLQATTDAYNATIPKATLIPITVLVVLAVFLLPFADTIAERFKQKIRPERIEQ